MRTKLRHRSGLAALVLAVALVAAACGGNDDDSGGGSGSEELSGSIKISGSSTVEPITSLAAEKFREQNANVNISVDGPGTGDGFELFCNGETDVSDASRAIKEEEAAACKAKNIEFTILPPPIGDAGQPVTVGGMGTYAVPKKADPARMAAAHALARYLTSAEVAADVPGWYLAPGTRKSIKVSDATPEMAAFEEMLPFVKFMPLIENWAKIDALIHPEVQLAVSGQKSPQQALDAAGTQITPLLPK